MSAATSAEPESVGLTWARRASLAASLSAPSFAPQPTLPAFTAQFIPPEPIFLPIEPHEPSPDDLDETNTRIFIKSLPPEFHDYSYLYRLFRAFGKIRMLAINTKRHNAIVEFESKVRNTPFICVAVERQILTSMCSRSSIRRPPWQPRATPSAFRPKLARFTRTSYCFPAE